MKLPIAVTLERFCHSDQMGTFGTLTLPSGMELYTAERPWINNQKSISSIPIGNYTCSPRRYFRGGYDAIEITNVGGRKYILFHKGNTILDVKGCVAVGTSLGFIKGHWAVTDSKGAFDCLMKELGGREFTLSVKSKANQGIVI